MYVQRLSIEDMELTDDHAYGKDVINPSWENIEAAIRQMDGYHRSTLSLGASDFANGFMGIGGGENGVYVCFVIDHMGNEFKLLNQSEQSDDTFEIYMGQMNIQSKKEAVDLSTVLRVARQYAESGSMDNSFQWQCAQT